MNDREIYEISLHSMHENKTWLLSSDNLRIVAKKYGLECPICFLHALFGVKFCLNEQFFSS
jgi:hypothetical protein